MEAIESRQQQFSIEVAAVVNGEHQLVSESRVGVGEDIDEGV